MQSILATHFLHNNKTTRIHPNEITYFNVQCSLIHLYITLPLISEEHTLRVFEKTVLRRIFGPKMDEVMGNGENCIRGSFTVCTHPQVLLGNSNQEKRDGRGMWQTWERREKCASFGGKPEGKKPLERPRRKWENGIKMDLREIDWEGVDWIHPAQVKIDGGLL
jgi:hypothetical protein